MGLVNNRLSIRTLMLQTKSNRAAYELECDC
jgi:hypothetical protein